MSAKENQVMASFSSVPRIKPEPQEQQILPYAISSPNAQQGLIDMKIDHVVVKPDPVDITSTSLHSVKAEHSVADISHVRASPVPQIPEPAVGPGRSLYTAYKSANEIQYVPEEALKEGLNMVKTIKTGIQTLELGSKLRKDVWLREIESLQRQGAPTTLIAVCGATGAGKSSILNAILEDNVVPTSGMRACTAVVTEIGYHNKKTIDADVSFLSEQEWREELKVLLEDLIDEDGYVKRTTDLRGDAGVAWQKVHAVYPLVTQDQLAKLTLDQLIERDPRIKAILGTTKRIVANNSKSFAAEIAKYIDSKDQKRGDKKDKKDKKEKEKGEQSFIAMMQKDKSKKKDERDGPAFWPLIRQVNVRCNSAALSTGAVLVDLPGVADANAARNNIAKDYMKKCDCIWILAPITRAVDDKTARDLLGDAFKMQLMNGAYDDHAITFIATKCDDISCSEVIRALNLDDEPELEEIEEQVQQCKVDTDEWKEKKAEAEKAARDIDAKLKEIREHITEHEAHVAALEKGEQFVPRLTAKSKRSKSTTAKKRKNTHSGKKGSSKKRRNDDDFMVVDDDDVDVMDHDGLDFSESDDDSDKQSEQDSSSDDDSDGSESSSGSEDEEDEDEAGDEEVTIENLKVKIDEGKAAIKDGRLQLSEYRKQRKEAADMLATLKKKQTRIQRDKNAFCSLKRSEFSRDVLKEDFRQGLKDLDDADAEQRDPNSFDPTVNLRDYEAIDLPVFTCSSRDYVRLKGQVKGDGDPTCFSKIEDTGIPDLQKWCHQLTVASRERVARNFLVDLKIFANSVRSYMEGIGDVTQVDRDALREKWESDMPDDDEEEMDPMVDDDYDDWHGADAIWQSLARNRMYTLNDAQKPPPKVDRYGEPIGVTPRLIKDFKQVIDRCVRSLQECFQDGLEERCRVGAANAASAAVETSDAFAASMHWATYRATLRRRGSWRQDLNVELTNPFTRNIASSWSKVFEADLFAAFEQAAMEVVNKLLRDVTDSAAPGLKERARGQGELCVQEARVALRKTLDVVRETMSTEQKEISRCLAPHVQHQLDDGYDRAMEETGRGSVARQKALFHNYVDDIKDEVFDDAADVLMGRLSNAAEAVGKALEESLGELAEKVEVSIAVLWEGSRDDPAQVKARVAVIATATEILEQVELWQQADQTRRMDTSA